MAAPRMRIETQESTSNEPAILEESVRKEAAPKPSEVAPRPDATEAGPKPTIAADKEVEPVAEPARREEVLPSQPVEQEGSGEEKKGSKLSIFGWVHKTFPGHEGAFWGAVLALLCALLIFWIGFFRVLFIVIVVVIGVAVGQYIDGDPKIIRAIRKLFVRDREEL